MVSIFKRMDLSNPDEYATKLAYDAMSRMLGSGKSKQVVWAELIGKADQIIKEVNDSDYTLSPSESARIRSKFNKMVSLEQSHVVKLYGHKVKNEPKKADVLVFDTSSAESTIAKINEGLSVNADGGGTYEYYEENRPIVFGPRRSEKGSDSKLVALLKELGHRQDAYFKKFSDNLTPLTFNDYSPFQMPKQK